MSEMKRYMNLCLVKTKNNDIVPVILPKGNNISTGDIVYVPTMISETPAKVMFARPYTEVDDDFWKMVVLTTGIEPIKVIKYGYIYECKWEDDEDEVLEEQ